MEGLKELIADAEGAIASAGDLAALDELRVRYLGKKGLITQQLKSLGQLPADERPAAGQRINEAKQRVAEKLEARREPWKPPGCSSDWPRRPWT